MADARAFVEAASGKPLIALPAGFGSTRAGLHLVAEHLLKPKRVKETGNEIALRYTPGGVGMDPWDGDPSGSARIEGLDVVLDLGGEEARVSASDHEAVADLLGVERPDQPDGGDLDPEAAAALAAWFAYGTVVLAELIDAFSDLDPEPIRLWPEHFDVATVLGDEAGGGRANYGASPGDEAHEEPYLYVGPWTEQPAGGLWNATAFPGAELRYADLLDADDPIGAGLEFLSSRAEALRDR